MESAEASLAEAQAGPLLSDVLAAQAEVNAAARALTEAQAGADPGEIAAAQDQLAVAQALQQEALAPLDTPDMHAAVQTARAERDAAAAELAELQAAAGTPLPVSEVVILPGLPRRVDQVDVSRGQLVDGPVLRVSGAQIVVDARVGGEDRQLLTEGMPAVIEHAGLRLDGRITAITRDAAPSDGAAGDEGAEGGFTVVVTPEGATPEQVEALRETNAKVTIPVSATDGEVLAVPLAALTAGPGGQARVEVVRDGARELVPVEVGLAAGGYAEIRPAPGTVEAGDAVVVGRAG